MKPILILIFSLFILSCQKEKKDSEAAQIVEIVRNMSLDTTNHFGFEPKMLSKKPMSLVKAIKEKKTNRQIRITGYVTNSCEMKGCWMIIKDKNQTVRVTFKDYSFFIPIGFKEKEVVLEGVLEENQVSEEVLKHYAQDAGASKEEQEQIKGPKKEYTFEASSVIILPEKKSS